MVNRAIEIRSHGLKNAGRVVGTYVVIVVVTLAVLGVLTATDPQQATSAAWVHAAIVAGFALLLPIRLRAARRGERSAVSAVVVIATVLVVVNVVEAAIPGFLPTWLRIEMVGVAVLMATVPVLLESRRR